MKAVSLTGLRDVDIIATIGPRLLASHVSQRMVELGASILRINGSHESLENIEIYSNRLRDWVGMQARILVDFPGNKVRTTGLSQPFVFSIGDEIELSPQQVNYAGFFEVLDEGEELLANDGLVRFDILRVSPDKLVLKAKTNGELGNHKGLHTSSPHDLPFLSEKDQKILELAKKLDIDYVGVSFIRQAEDVKLVKGILSGSSVKMLAKVETKEAVKNLDSILAEADQILIDRGDLCADIGYVLIPYTQDRIIREARKQGVKVALATQFLHSMLTRDVPVIAEVEAIYHAVKAGVSAIQVSEETSVGPYPEEVVSVMANMIFQALREESEETGEEESVKRADSSQNLLAG